MQRGPLSDAIRSQMGHMRCHDILSPASSVLKASRVLKKNIFSHKLDSCRMLKLENPINKQNPRKNNRRPQVYK